MSYKLNTLSGGTEAVIDDNCGISKFYLIADTLVDELHIKFLNKFDDSETFNWEFFYNSYWLTLHYNKFNGVSILPNSNKGMDKENNAVMEIASFLEMKVY